MQQKGSFSAAKANAAKASAAVDWSGPY